MKVLKRVGAIFVDVLIVALVLLSIIISISSITAKANNGVPDLFGYSPFSVQTDSMSPTLVKGDYIFVEKCDTTELESLQKDDIVTYFTFVNGQRVVNTHRIVEVHNLDGMVQYETKGDNNLEADATWLSPGDIIGTYTGTKIPVMGTVIDYLSTQTGFFLVILLPVLLFTIYQIYKLVKVILYNHKVDTLNSLNDSASEEVKEAIIAEYLAKQQDLLEKKRTEHGQTESNPENEEEKKEAEDKND